MTDRNSLKRITLVVAGGIAAYKSLELVRRLQDVGIASRVVMTKGAQQFIQPLSFAALTEDKVYSDLFSLTDESEMGHIRLSRESDLILVCPATADILTKMAMGQADDLATTIMLASDKPIMVAPSMNVMMWQHPATQANLATLMGRGVEVIGPADGDLACGEVGSGRLSDVPDIVQSVSEALGLSDRPLSGKRAIVTSGPTHEAIDPVRYIANSSSGKQGHAIAGALARAGAEVTLISGPVAIPDPAGCQVVRVKSARDMLAATEQALEHPVDIAVFAAAVADWRPATEADEKLKKQKGETSPTLKTIENPDILAAVSQRKSGRPSLVVGFAAETQNLIENATSKRKRKGCDWILANDVSPELGTFGGDRNRVTLISAEGAEAWPDQSKSQVAAQLAARIVDELTG